MTQEHQVAEAIVRRELEQYVSAGGSYYPAGFYANDADNATDAIIEALATAGLLRLAGSQQVLLEEPGIDVTVIECLCHHRQWQMVYAPPNSRWIPVDKPQQPHPTVWSLLKTLHPALVAVTKGDVA